MDTSPTCNSKCRFELFKFRYKCIFYNDFVVIYLFQTFFWISASRVFPLIWPLVRFSILGLLQFSRWLPTTSAKIINGVSVCSFWRRRNISSNWLVAFLAFNLHESKSYLSVNHKLPCIRYNIILLLYKYHLLLQMPCIALNVRTKSWSQYNAVSGPEMWVQTSSANSRTHLRKNCTYQEKLLFQVILRRLIDVWFEMYHVT